MTQIFLRDAATGSTARIAPALGFNCYEFCADVDGEIAEVLAENGQAVEYGQPLFRLAPAGNLNDRTGEAGI